jgi:hypothetical protein
MRSLVLALALSFAAGSAQAGQGVGVRNGGTGVRCGDRPLILLDLMNALRFSDSERIEDREAFITRVLSRIPDARFAKLLRERWDLYGDSESWPSGNLQGIDVFYYLTPTRREVYPFRGVLPPMNPQSHVCTTFPIYAPDDCCERVLISYFAKDDAMPTKLAAHYSELDRFQKNLLELHEAVFRVARELGRLPSPSRNAYVHQEIGAYLASASRTDELPSNWVAMMVASLVADREDARDLQEKIETLWAWSFAIYSPHVRAN